VKHAARGTREIRGKTEPLGDDTLAASLRQSGLRTVRTSLLLATALTAATLLLPA